MEWKLIGSYQKLVDKAKALLEKNICTKFYNETRPLYLEVGACGVGLGPGLLHMKDGMNCAQDEVADNTTMGPIAFNWLSVVTSHL